MIILVAQPFLEASRRLKQPCHGLGIKVTLEQLERIPELLAAPSQSVQVFNLVQVVMRGIKESTHNRLHLFGSPGDKIRRRLAATFPSAGNSLQLATQSSLFLP